MKIIHIQSSEGKIDIDLDTAQAAGGKAGSVRVPDGGGNFYQYKSPITDNSFKRKAKSQFADSENFGEVLAARIAKACDKEKDNPRVPSVSFVTVDKSRNVAIASKYLTGKEGSTVQSLDEYLKKPPEKSHIKLVCGSTDSEKGLHNIDDNPLLKKELAQAIALSALVGDHDVNPGNMIIIKEENGAIRLGRIDFGHAFKDLMRFSNVGGKTVHNNNIIDFFNRETVDGINYKSKLWRDYPGLTPSKEMADALKDLAIDVDTNKITQAIEEVSNEVKNLLAKTNIDKAHVIRSFQRIAEHVSGEKIGLKRIDKDDGKIDAIFEKLKAYGLKNQQQMAYAGQVMDLQVKIQQAVNNGHDTEPFKKQYDELVKDGNKTDLGPFSWIKAAPKNPPFKGNFEQFVEHQKTEKKLTAITDIINKFLDTNAKDPENEARLVRDLKAIVINPKKSAEDKMSLLENKVQKLDADPKPKSGWFSKLINSILSLGSSNSPYKAVTQTAKVGSFKTLKTELQDVIASKKPKQCGSDLPGRVIKFDP